MAQRKINQLKASGNSGGLAGGGAAAGEQAARGGGGSPVAGGPAAASADAADTARLHQLLQASAVGRWRQAAGGSAPPLGGARRAACMECLNTLLLSPCVSLQKVCHLPPACAPQKRTTELDEREDALIKADRWAACCNSTIVVISTARARCCPQLLPWALAFLGGVGRLR